MKYFMILIIGVIFSGCAGRRIKPYHEPSFVCADRYDRENCLKTIDNIDNGLLFRHDYREIENLEVPVR